MEWEMTEQEAITKIARVLWKFDREHGIIPCWECNNLPVALPQMALSLELNTNYYGSIAKAIWVLVAPPTTEKEEKCQQ